MRRRDFFFTVGIALPLAPRIARAENRAMKRVGILMNGNETNRATREDVASFVAGLNGLGWVKDRNLRIDYRWGGQDDAGFQRGAAELLRLAPDAILASTTPAVRALRERGDNVPIVFVVVTDPVGQGFVANLARPGGNITGFSNYDSPMSGKWLGLLKEIVPGLKRVSPLFNPVTAPYTPLLLDSMRQGADTLSVEVNAAAVQSVAEMETVIAALGREPASGLIVLPDGFNTNHRLRIIALAERYRVPAIYPYSNFAQGGGLLSYGIVVEDLFRRAAPYVDHILKGVKPSELPVQAPTSFELVINLKTAKALGLTVPPTLLASADEVIE
jgi:putative tryptophan/tyrosine transport system substrate-binding protein